MGTMKPEDVQRVEAMARRMRRRMVEVAYNGKGYAHFGGGFSIVEILAVLYGTVLKYDVRNPEWPERDRFILSKGHGVLGFYAVLEAAGYFSEERLNTFQQDGGDFSSHPVMNLALGIETSNGSLGHGLSLGIGSLLAARRKRMDYGVYVLLGNGECNEGSVWEAAMSAAHFRLDRLTAIVDHNRMQSDGASADVLDMGTMALKWKAFGWNVAEVDGHSIEQLHAALTSRERNGKPTAVVATTVKGRGISFMEGNNEWHHNRLNREQYEQAWREVGGSA